ncbi:MAG: hydroxymethylbilane synthase, partial [Planctomycetota bacterium]
MPLRLGTRTSRLAMWQAHWVASELHHQGIAVDLVPIAVTADQDTRPIAELGQVGVFTKEIQRALLDQQIDLAVHCLKDLPAGEVPHLQVAAILPRESAADCLVSRAGASLAALPAGARIGTGSVRRRCQLLNIRSDLRIEGIRGNVDTRLQKLDAEEYDALVLAEAGLVRLARRERITQVFDVEQLVPAAGQGALAIEIRQGDERAHAAARALHDPDAGDATNAERYVMTALGGGCDAAIGVHAAKRDAAGFRLTTSVLSRDGQHQLRESIETTAERLLEEA